MPQRLAERLVGFAAAIFLALIAVVGRPSEAQAQFHTLCAGCGSAVYYANSTFPTHRDFPTDTAFTYTVSVRNDSTVSVFVELIGFDAPGQFTCTTAHATEFSVAAGQSVPLTVNCTTKGIGQFKHRLYLERVPGGLVDSLYPPAFNVTGTPIVTHASPPPGAKLSPKTDSLKAFMADPSGIVPSSFKTFLNGVDKSAKIVLRDSSHLFTFDTTLTPGTTYTWKTYGCAVDGRCDTVKTTFVTADTTIPYAIDDSLPPPNGTGESGLLGGLPLPPNNLLGCPQVEGAPEIRIAHPISWIPQGQVNKPAGNVFMATNAFTDATAGDSLTIVIYMHDYKVSDHQSCADYTYLNRGSFDWLYWTGTNKTDSLWLAYPYSDSLQLVQRHRRAWDETPLDYAFDYRGPHRGKGDWLIEPLRRALGLPAPRESLGPSAALAMRAAAAHRRTTSRMLPDAGDIDTASFKLTLNGTTIVDTGRHAMNGASITGLVRAFAMVRIAPNNGLLHTYNSATPTTKPGGWNELVATVADTGGNATSVRARFVHIPTGNQAPLKLTPLRDFAHLDQGDCAAFGPFQCGGVTLTHTIPGFVTRDKARDLHLVYRSVTQRVPTILPVRLQVSRTQRAPDSLTARPTNGGSDKGPVLRYAGKFGAPVAPNTEALWENANEDRVIGTQLDAPSTGSFYLRKIKHVVHPYYSGGAVVDDTVSQDVIQRFLTDTTATRIGQGWQLAEVSQLHFPTDSFKGAPAIIRSFGDGSYVVYRKVGSAWIPAAGETAKLVDSTVTAGLVARWAVYLDNGWNVGYRADGRQVWQSDPLGNYIRYAYDSPTGTRLLSITDSTGTSTRKKWLFRYDDAGATKGLLRRILIQPSSTASDTTLIASFDYAGSPTDPNLMRLTQVTTWRSASQGDVTRFTYKTTSVGAMIDSVVDPRSTGGAPIATVFNYDSLWSPVSVSRPPDKYGVATAQFREAWRRAVPRATYGRGSLPLERLVFANQLVGTSLGFTGQPSDYAVDRFGAPTMVRRISPEPKPIGGFAYEYYGGDDVRDIERDTLSGRVLKIVQARDSIHIADSVMYQYDALWRVTSIVRPTRQYPVIPIDSPGGRVLDTLRFSYDTMNLTASGRWCSRTTGMWDEMGVKTSILYSSSVGVKQCLVERVIGPVLDTTWYNYAAIAVMKPQGLRPVSIRDPLGRRDSLVYDAGTWNLQYQIRLTDTATTQVFYNKFGFVDSVADPLNVKTRFIRDRTGRPIRSKTGDGLKAPTVATVYDAGGLVTETDVYASIEGDLDAAVPGTAHRTKNYFDRLGQVDSLVSVVGTASGRPVDPTTGYKARRQWFVRMRDGVPLYQYPGNGSVVRRLTDWQGRVTYQDNGAVARHISLDGERFADHLSDSIITAMASVGLPSRVWSPGQTYEYSYNNKGQLSRTVSRDGLVDTFTTRRIAYSRAGLVIADTTTFTDGAIVVRAFEYNRRGQRVRATDAVAITHNTTGTGAELTGVRTFIYNDTTGRVTEIIDSTAGKAASRVAFTYDKLGRELTRLVRPGGNSATKGFTTTTHYDATGRIDTMTTLAGSGFTAGGAANKIWYRFRTFPNSYNRVDDLLADSAIKAPVLGATLRLHTYVYDTNGTRRLVESKVGTSNTNRWVYDVFGNRMSEYRNPAYPCNVGVQSTATFVYDTDDRIRYQNSHIGCNDGIQYLYDQTGARIAETDSVTVAQNAVRAAMTYTAQGLLNFSITGGQGSFDINFHRYDAEGRRATTDFYVGSSLADITNNANQAVRRYYVYECADVMLVLERTADSVWYVTQRNLMGGTDQPLAMRSSSYAGVHQNLLYLTDRQGTMLGAADSTGVQSSGVNAFLRGAFGEILGATGARGSVNGEAGFAGAGTPNSTGGFTYLRNRWYDGATGRFLTQDPIGLAGGVNLYAYAGNNPIAFSDPYGLSAGPCKSALTKGISWATIAICAADLMSKESTPPETPRSIEARSSEGIDKLNRAGRKFEGPDYTKGTGPGPRGVGKDLLRPSRTPVQEPAPTVAPTVAITVSVYAAAALVIEAIVGGFVEQQPQAVCQVEGCPLQSPAAEEKTNTSTVGPDK